MTDDEAAELRRSGIHLSTWTTRRRRLDAPVVSGTPLAGIADRLRDANPFHSEQRESRSRTF
ncbi:hypothetical protein ACERNI_00560 [Camelimonas sp. ID_303_24]